MSQSGQVLDEMGGDEPLPVLQLTNWPLRYESRQAAMVAAGILGFATTIGLLTRNAWIALAAVLSLVIVTWRTWLPVRFELDVRGVQWSLFRWRHFVPWQDIAGFHEDRLGVILYAGNLPWPWLLFHGLNVAGRDVTGRDCNDELQRTVNYYAAAPREDERRTVVLRQ